MSDRPPFYNPSYPAYPGAPPGPYPPSYNGSQWRPPASYNPSAYPSSPGFPGRPPVAPMYPALHQEGIDNKDFGWIPPSHCVGSHHYVPAAGGTVPPDAVHAGQDKDGGPIYVGRAYHDGDLLPAKICPSHGCAFVCHGGVEITKMQYEVLCSNNVAWKYSRGGEYPPEAIRVGTTSTGEPLFVGRTMLEGTMTPGKVHPSHGVLYVPFEGREMSFPEYEILILN